MNIRSREELIDWVRQGQKIKYIFFWGNEKPKSGVSKTCFSQWYNSPFTLDDATYSTAEHYMMAEKAKLFGQRDITQKIITCGHPGEAKKLGREIKGFNETIWEEHRYQIVIAANCAKFGQNPELKRFLLNTGNRILVEASPVDKIWGVGLAEGHPDIENPSQWKGENLLGFALMEVRDQLREQNLRKL